MDRQSLKGVQLAIRAAAGAGISFAMAQILNLDHPIIAFTASVIVTDLRPAQSRELGLRRLGATVVGGVSGAALGSMLQPTAPAIAASVLLAMLISYGLRAREGAKVAGYICGLIVLDHGAEPWRDAVSRTAETSLGVAVAWLISYVPKLIRIEEPSEQNKVVEGPHAPPSRSSQSAP